MKKLFSAAALTLLLTGCAHSAAAPPPSREGQPFLPAYLAILQGKPSPNDEACQPRDLHELLMPCDQP